MGFKYSQGKLTCSISSNTPSLCSLCRWDRIRKVIKINLLAPWKKSYEQLREHIKKQRHYFANKGLSSQSYGFSSSHVWMWELDHKESWAPKNWCFWAVVLEKTLESPLDCKEIQPVHPKGDHSWILIGKTDVEAETLILWPSDVKNWLIWTDPDAGKDWRWEEKVDNRGWDGSMASLTQWIWVWVNSRSWGWTWRPVVLQSMGSQRVRHDWRTELNWKINWAASVSKIPPGLSQNNIFFNTSPRRFYNLFTVFEDLINYIQ